MSAEQSSPSIRRIHHLELVVGNAKQAAYYYRKAFGFGVLAYRGLETGEREVTSYVLAQGMVRLVLSTPMHAEHPHQAFLRAHGDAVLDIALEVDDVDQAYALCTERGAKGLLAPTTEEDDAGQTRRACIGTYGDVRHSLIAAGEYSGPFLPGYEALGVAEEGVGLLGVDHVVGNVELGKMNSWADFYQEVMGFHRYITFDDKDISTEYSALQSVVMASADYAVKFPINEPAQGKRLSQIQEYIDFNAGAGVQHIAILTQDIVTTVQGLRARGVEFLHIPDTYYENVLDRVGSIDEPLDTLRPLGILIDRDDEGYLLQLFTKPVEDRPTLFIEIIQRKGARGFGKGNFRALFESIEREQARRGNL